MGDNMTVKSDVEAEIARVYKLAAVSRESNSLYLRVLKSAYVDLQHSKPQNVAYKLVNTIRTLKQNQIGIQIPDYVRESVERLNELSRAENYDPLAVQHWLANTAWNKTYLDYSDLK